MFLYLAMLETTEERENFSEYYKKHYGKCLAVAKAITKNQAWAEEAVQNAFIRLITHKEKYFTDERKKTATTIVIMVKGESLNILKREKRLDHLLLEDNEPIVANNEPDAFRIVAGKEAYNKVEQHILELDEVNQALYEMKYIQGLTDSEISKIVNISENAVATRMHRMRKILIKTLKEEGYIDE